MALRHLPLVVGRFRFLSAVSSDGFDRVPVDVYEAQVLNKVIKCVYYNLLNRPIGGEVYKVGAGTLSDHVVGQPIVHGRHDGPDAVGDSVVQPAHGQRVQLANCHVHHLH